MANSDGHLSARLRRAQERLERAVDGLDSAVEKSLVAVAEEDGARADIAELEKTAEIVSARLDSTIGRLRAVLED